MYQITHENCKKAGIEDMDILKMWSFLNGMEKVNIPNEYVQLAKKFVKDEKVPCISNKAAEGFMNYVNAPLARLGRDETVIEYNQLPRFQAEYGSGMVQLVCSTLIHTDKHIVALKLRNISKHIDGYHVGSVTMPQGHMTFEGSPKIMPETGLISNANLLSYAGKAAFRETMEELSFRKGTDPVEVEYMRDFIKEEIAKGTQIDGKENTARAFRINVPGTTIRHIVVNFDIHVKELVAQRMIDEDYCFISGEPNKHEVAYMDAPAMICKANDLCWYFRMALRFSAKWGWTWKFFEDYIER